MDWQPPTKEAFDNRWLTPRRALDVLSPELSHEQRRRYIIRRLRTGQLVAVARSGQPDRRTDVERRYCTVPSGFWEAWDQDGDDDFWDAGDAVFNFPTSPAGIDGGATSRHFLDVRIDPAGFAGVSPKALPPEPGPEPAHEAARGRPHLSRADAERFCRALLSEWPDVTQDNAHDRAVGFFADHHVPRDWFRSILRSIRGPQKPGKKPRTED